MVVWLNDARLKRSTTGDQITLSYDILPIWMMADSLWTITDQGAGDRWNVALEEVATGKELWRKEGLGPLETAEVPRSLLTVGALYAVKSERFMQDGRTVSDRSLIEVADHEQVMRVGGLTYTDSDSLYHDLTTEGAVQARVTLRDAKTGATILQTLLTQVWGRTVQLSLMNYLDQLQEDKEFTATWEELDAGGRTIATSVDPISYKLRKAHRPVWKQGGGQVIGPTGQVEWEPAPGARWYQVVVTDGKGNLEDQMVLPAKTTQYQPTKPLQPGFHWIRVSSEGGGCRQDWSESLPVIVDERPFQGILSPLDNAAVGRDLTVRLRRTPWIESYQVDLIEVATNTRLQTTSWYQVQAGESVTFDTSHLKLGTSYRIEATATLKGVPVPQKDSVVFTYNPPVELGFNQPLQGARLPWADLALSWDPFPGAKGYRVLVTTVLPFANLQIPYAAGSATSLTLPKAEFDRGRTYRLTLEATMADGSKRTSAPVTFTIEQ